MDRARRPWQVVTGGVALMLCASVAAQDKQFYRYTDADGKVVYSDQLPPPGARNVQPKRMDANVIDTSDPPIAAQRAAERFPVTLYTFDCGELCQGAEALLNKRGIPFNSVNVSDPAGAARLKALTGNNLAPVLQVGDKLVSKGLSEQRWQAMLDEAGYPRTPPLRRLPPGKGTETPPVAKAATNTPPPSTLPPPGGPPSAVAPAPGAAADGGYPK
ncbi:MAG: glutaredoxin family protein [Betaproteobacteria bacterium]